MEFFAQKARILTLSKLKDGINWLKTERERAEGGGGQEQGKEMGWWLVSLMSFMLHKSMKTI